MFDRLFKGKKRRAEKQRQQHLQQQRKQDEPQRPVPQPAAAPSQPAPAPGGAPAAPVDPRTAEERCGIVAGMEQAAIKAQLAKMFRRYNRLASSLDGADRIEAEQMLDLIVQLREKYLR